MLAKTFEAIANSEDPVKFFYDSNLTERMVGEISKNGNFLRNLILLWI